LASLLAAKQYGGRVLARGIEDDKQNYTRFLHVVRAAKQPKARSKAAQVRPTKLDGANKTSIAFSLRNEAGALFKALSVFALRDISLAKIESRPVRGRPWEYVFFTDFLRGDDDVARNGLRHLGELAAMVKVLGVYRAAG